MRCALFLIVCAGLLLATLGPVSAEVIRVDNQLPWNGIIYIDDSRAVSIEGSEYEMINIRCSHTGECFFNMGSIRREGMGAEESTGTEYRYTYENFRKAVFPSDTITIHEKITLKLVSPGSAENYIMHCNVREIFDDGTHSMYKCTMNQVPHNQKF